MGARRVQLFFGVQEGHFLGVDLCCITLVAVLLILPGLDPALHVDPVSLAQESFAKLCEFVSDHDIVPFGGRDPFSSLFVRIGLIGRHGEPSDGVASFEVVHFDLISQMPDEHYLVQ